MAGFAGKDVSIKLKRDLGIFQGKQTQHKQITPKYFTATNFRKNFTFRTSKYHDNKRFS